MTQTILRIRPAPLTPHGNRTIATNGLGMSFKAASNPVQCLGEWVGGRLAPGSNASHLLRLLGIGQFWVLGFPKVWVGGFASAPR